ncbi:hypothetical protein ASZ90_003833 [hydrocarbon metagenome]|uniref:WD40-like Beta Propeller Repeat n=1 Tax=hydrocarbon metagenome TaxID=938273 RepID=A0A0W8FZL1_9ZZZZ
MKIIFTTIAVFLLLTSCTKEIPDNPKRYTNLFGEYMGQPVPNTSAEVFASGVISTGMYERDAAFYPDGSEFYNSVFQNNRSTLVYTRQINGRWTLPKVVSFSGIYNDIEPFITHDGKKLYFASNRPIEGGEPKDYDIWYSERMDDGGWGEPIVLGPEVNTEANEFYPSLTENGDLYFTSDNHNSLGKEDIFVSRFVDGSFLEYENLGDSVNSVDEEFNSFIAPDGSYLIYTTTGFGDGFGGGDLWICFKKEDQKWSSPKNLGENVNSHYLDFSPSLTPDGKFLFFSSNRVLTRNYETRTSYEQMIREFNNPYNGNGDIFWVSTEVIQNLKQ